MATKNAQIIALRTRAIELGLVPNLEAAKRLEPGKLRRMVTQTEQAIAEKTAAEQAEALKAQRLAEEAKAWTSVREASSELLGKAKKTQARSEAAQKGQQTQSARVLAKANEALQHDTATAQRHPLALRTQQLADRWGGNARV